MNVDPASLGRRVAGRFIVRGIRPAPRTLAQQMGIAIEEQEAPPPAQPQLRSEYQHDSPRIILYRDPLDTLIAAIHANQRFDMMRCDLDEAHIAHELFHHLEFGQRFGQLVLAVPRNACHAEDFSGVEIE